MSKLLKIPNFTYRKAKKMEEKTTKVPARECVAGRENRERSLTKASTRPSTFCLPGELVTVQKISFGFTKLIYIFCNNNL